VQVVDEWLPVLDGDHSRLISVARQRRREHGWNYVICVTDSPMRDGDRPVAADVITEDGIAVVSLPAFGTVLLRQRLRDLLVDVLAELVGRHDPAGSTDPAPLSGLPGELQRVTPRRDDGDGGAVRIMANHSKLRLLLGMVYANRPWRLVYGLTGALAAALATGAYVLVTPTIWELADSLQPIRLTVITIFAVTTMVVWLILDHNLWVSRSDAISRSEANLYNASTVLTLVLGVLSAYLKLFTISLIVATFLIDEDLFQRKLGHPVGFPGYLHVAWFAASLSLLAGALGSGFDSEESARRAAYGARERERRAALKDWERQHTA
jgi:hypothetical protein